MRHVVFVAVLGLALALALPARGQTPDAQALRNEIEQLRKDLDALQKQYGDRLALLEGKLAQLAEAQAAPPAPAPVVVPTGGSKVFNPDIAVIGDVLGAAGKNPVNGSPALELHEAELSFQAVVDPYARADFFFTFGPEGAGVEEAYITFPTLPAGLLMKAGMMRAAFGKVNELHNHVLPWTDRPLVTNNLVGGEDGIHLAGLSVARLIPNPWVFLEATGQVFYGSSDVFTSSRRRDLAYVGHVRGYQDITESSNLDIGVSYSRGPTVSSAEVAGPDGADQGRFQTQIYGVDATFRYRPLRRSIYRSFIGRSELVWSRREQTNGLQRSFGCYVSGQYQFARRWFTGIRFDRSDRADAATTFDTGQSLMLTYWPSEFSQVRAQYRRTRYAQSTTANEFLFQFQFSIGSHGAHPF